MVRTDEFALIRFGGDAERAAAVYAGVAEPLVAEDIADCVAWCATRPQHVNIDRLVVRPLAQAAQHKVHRAEPSVHRGRSARSPGARPTRTGCAGSTTGSSRTLRATCCRRRPTRWWSTSATAPPRSPRVELRAPAAARSAPDVRVVGLEIDPARVAAAAPAADPPRPDVPPGRVRAGRPAPGAGAGVQRAAPVRRGRGARTPGGR